MGPANRNFIAVLLSGSSSNLFFKPKAVQNKNLHVICNNLRALIGRELFTGNVKLMLPLPSHTSQIGERKKSHVFYERLF